MTLEIRAVNVAPAGCWTMVLSPGRDQKPGCQKRGFLLSVTLRNATLSPGCPDRPKGVQQLLRKNAENPTTWDRKRCQTTQKRSHTRHGASVCSSFSESGSPQGFPSLQHETMLKWGVDIKFPCCPSWARLQRDPPLRNIDHLPSPG
ncbi:hypothetical protein VTJ04DRAFT_4492 [Mycothermus thermophilus]|uniref:uncharacterized protein n=1 Tax=Humicola insolens TaxID=85995 RepID=UPI003742F3E9